MCDEKMCQAEFMTIAVWKDLKKPTGARSADRAALL